MNNRGHRTGFTIVELLIVIVVIAILAAITIVAFNGVQARASDARMRSSMNQFEKAIRNWAITMNDLPKGGWGSTVGLSGSNCIDGSGGWVFSGAYTCSLEDVLIAQKLIPSGFTRSLPPNKSYGSNTDGALAVMFYPCGSTGKYALFWHLLNPTADDTASLATVEAAGCTTAPRTTYGMKAAKLIALN